MPEWTNPTHRGGRALRVSLLAVLLAGTALGGYAAGQSLVVAPANAATPAVAQAPDFVPLVARVKPAVVSITNDLRPHPAAMQGAPPGPFPFPFPFPFGMQPTHPQAIQARGSGFIISPSGLIVTNNHVIKDAKSLTVILDNGTRLPARVVGADPRTDLAVLKVNAGHPLPYVKFGNSASAQPGEWVIAMGNPFGLGGTVTAGIVSAIGRNIGDGPYDQFIQVDAPINEGNSGGPLFNLNGHVIGVNTAIISPSGGSVGIGFSIPSNTVRTVVAELEKSGHVIRGYLGVAAQPITPNMQQALHLPSESGALIAAVEPGTPAERAGLHPGEVITEVDGKPIKNPRDLAIDVAAIKPGQTAHLKMINNGSTVSMNVTLTTLPEHIASNNTAPSPQHGRLGLALAPITPQAQSELNLPAGTHGAVVAEVAPNSPAALAGIQSGDVIIGVGEQPVHSVQEAVHAIHTAESRGGAVALRVMHDGQKVFVAINLGKGAGKQG
ncbi:MAG: Do family serine endopeptidase [Rhodospirillales bacterium]|nr:Do family serine endopeptidase [Rhodospirillales bacterium]